MYKYTSIVVDSDGVPVVWTNGSLSAPLEIRNRIKRASDLGRSVELIHGVAPVVASLEDDKDYPAITAALFAGAPGRTRLLEGPDELIAWFEEKSEYEEGVIY